MKNRAYGYASYTYNHPNFLVSYPHRKRNELVAKQIAEIAPASWMDYGAGDGALLDELLGRDALPESVTCYEPDAGMYSQLADHVSKLGKSDASIKLAATLPGIDAQFDLVTALEVLEHLPLPERIKFYSFLATRLKKDGSCLIEVPVEYGPVLLLKEWGRKFIKNRVSGYSFRELANAALLGKILDAHSRYRQHDDRTFISPHQGFDLKRLLIELNTIGSTREVARSPFPYLPRIFNQSLLFSFELRVRNVPKIMESVTLIYQAAA
jgi:phospholipid N-methyltransferase